MELYRSRRGATRRTGVAVAAVADATGWGSVRPAFIRARAKSIALIRPLPSRSQKTL